MHHFEHAGSGQAIISDGGLRAQQQFVLGIGGRCVRKAGDSVSAIDKHDIRFARKDVSASVGSVSPTQDAVWCCDFLERTNFRDDPSATCGALYAVPSLRRRFGASVGSHVLLLRGAVD